MIQKNICKLFIDVANSLLIFQNIFHMPYSHSDLIQVLLTIQTAPLKQCLILKYSD